MPPPDGEQRCQGVCNPGTRQNDKRLKDSYYDIVTDRFGRAQTLVETRIGNDGRLIFTYNESMQSRIPAFRVREEGLVATTLIVEAPARADYRDFATDWEIQNSPFCIFSHRYQPIVDEGNQVLAYGRVEWITGVAHFIQNDIDGIEFDNRTIAEKGLVEDIVGNELVAAIATLGGSLLIRSLARAAITSSSRFLGVAIAEGAIDAARGVSTAAFRLALLGLRAIRARALVRTFTSRGLRVIVNIGGEAAEHELKQGPQIAVNSFGLGRGQINRIVPNLIREKGENIGTLFGKETVDRIISSKLPTSIDTQAVAQGAAKVLKPGGTLQMSFLPDQEFVDTFVRQLRAAGFKSAKAQFTPPFPNAPSLPSNAFVEAIR